MGCAWPWRRGGGAAAGRKGKPTSTPLPRRAIAMVVFVQFSEAFQITVLLPFVPFMVATFPEVTEETVGLYAGLVAAAFPFGQLCSSVLWGKVADRIGAKRVVLFSLMLTCVCTVAFGFSTSLVMAVLLRLAAGLCNGNVGVVKSYLGKVTDASNQGQAMALLSAAWSLGSIIAPTLGGFLANPAEQFPDTVVPGTVLYTWPYLLPCLIAASCIVVSILLTIFFMKEADEVLREIAERRERLAQSDDDDGTKQPADDGWLVRTRRWFAARRDAVRPATRGRGRAYGRVAGPTDSDTDSDDGHEGDGHEHENENEGDGHGHEAGDGHLESQSIRAHSGPALSGPAHSGPALSGRSLSADDTDELAEVPLKGDAPAHGAPPHGGPPSADARSAMLARMGSSVTSVNADGTVTLEPLHYRPPRLRHILFATSMYGLVALFFSFVDDIFPIYCRDTFANGGLEFSTNDIGTALAFMGGISIGYNVLIYPILARKYGLMTLYRTSLLVAVPMCLVFPCINLLGAAYGAQAIWPVLLFNLFLRGVVGLHMFTTVMVYINNSVPRERMGYANGIGQSFAAAVRAFGPTLAGILWSTLSRASFPGSQFIIFIVAALMLALQYVLSFRYPPSIQKPFVKVPIDDPEATGMSGTSTSSIEMLALVDKHDGSDALTSSGNSSPESRDLD